MKTRIGNTILIIAAMLFGFMGIVQADDPRNGVSKITVKNETPYPFRLAFVPAIKQSSGAFRLLKSTVVVNVEKGPNSSARVNTLLSYSGEPYALAYEHSTYYFEIMEAVEGQKQFKGEISWGSTNTFEDGFGFYLKSPKDTYVHVHVKFHFINKDDLQVTITPWEN